MQPLIRPRSSSAIGVNLIKIGALYLVGRLLLGIVLGISHNYNFSSLLAHVLLLGWVTMMISGVVYIVLPGCEQGWLVRIHYRAFNLGLPTMIVGLALLSFGDDVVEKLVAPGAIVSLAAVVAFAINGFRNGGRELHPTKTRASTKSKLSH